MAMLISMVIPANAQTPEDVVTVDFDTDIIELPPGETRNVRFTVTNDGGEAIGVAFEFIHLKTMGHPDGYFTTSYIVIAPNSTKETELVLTSNAGSGDDPSDSDFIVRIHYGRDLQLDEDDEPIDSTVEGTWEHDFQVVFLADTGPGPIWIVVIFIIAILLGVVLLLPGFEGDEGLED